MSVVPILVLFLTLVNALPGNGISGYEVSDPNVAFIGSDLASPLINVDDEAMDFDIFHPVFSDIVQEKRDYKKFVDLYLDVRIQKYGRIRAFTPEQLVRFLENPYVLANQRFMARFDGWLELASRFSHGAHNKMVDFIIDRSLLPNDILLKFFYLNRVNAELEQIQIIALSTGLSTEQLRAILFFVPDFPALTTLKFKTGITEDLADELVKSLHSESLQILLIIDDELSIETRKDVSERLSASNSQLEVQFITNSMV